MSIVKEVKKDLGLVKNHWVELDSRIKLLDKMAVLQIFLFALGFIFVSAFEIKQTVSNSAMMMFPVVMAGIMFVYRSRLSRDINEANEARKEYILFSFLFLGLVLMTFVYTVIFIIITK